MENHQPTSTVLTVMTSDDGESLAKICALAALDKKAEDVIILDMRGISSFTDFFVICSAASEPQLKAIASEVRLQVRDKTNHHPKSEDGFPSSQWIVIDFDDVIVHIFHADKRDFYRLEDLWNDAPRIEIE